MSWFKNFLTSNNLVFKYIWTIQKEIKKTSNKLKIHPILNLILANRVIFFVLFGLLFVDKDLWFNGLYIELFKAALFENFLLLSFDLTQTFFVWAADQMIGSLVSGFIKF